MRYLIGFGLIALGGILSAVTEIMWFLILLFIGVVLFASIPSSANFCDYIIANSNVALIKTRHYWNFLPLTIVSSILTLGKAPLVIPWKEDYFKVTVECHSGPDSPQGVCRCAQRTTQDLLYTAVKQGIYGKLLFPQCHRPEAQEEKVGHCERFGCHYALNAGRAGSNGSDFDLRSRFYSYDSLVDPRLQRCKNIAASI